jgi:REP element-mobilizing transposase RayT
MNRLKNFNYSSQNFYFVTICVKNHQNFFGQIQNKKMIFNQYGKIAKREWDKTEILHEKILLDEFIIMPDHIHGIIFVKNPNEPTWSNNPQKRKNQLIPLVVELFKAAVSREINKTLNNERFQWQKSFHDNIIKYERGLIKIRNYIKQNPIKYNVQIHN